MMATTPTLQVGTVRFSHSTEGRPSDGVVVFRTVPTLRVTGGGESALYDTEDRIGVLVDGQFELQLTSTTDDSTVQPTGRQWRAQFLITGTNYPPARFDLAPGQLLNLADVVDISDAPAVVKVVTDEDRRAAEAAADRAEAAAAGSGGGSGGGTDGREVELRTTATAVQWRYVGAPTWIDLVQLSQITGAAGGSGKSVELQNTGTYIQYRLVGEPVWSNLVELATLRGPQGNASTVPGPSAYAVWLSAGNTGTQQQFLASLVGAAGKDSTVAGPVGASAYQIWLANGNTGTEAQYLASLKGTAGTIGATGPEGPAGNVRLLAAGVTVAPTDAQAGTIIAYRA